MNQITIPYNFRPRPYQLPFLRAMDRGVKRAVCVWHRRAGKDKLFWNFMIKEACTRIGVYYYFFPSYRQGRKILWDGIDKSQFHFLDHIPKELIANKNDTEMKIKLVNGSVIQIVGTDNIDSVVGTNPVGCVFSEYALQDPKAWEFIRPILRENGGWAVFNFTPRGENHGWDLLQVAKANPDEWFWQVLTVNDTRLEDGTAVLTSGDVEMERRSGMSEELILQEFYCSFTAAIIGAYFATQLREAEEAHPPRVTSVPYVSNLPVYTYWDLGVGDATAILFVQKVGKELHIIDYYEATGEGLPHYARVLQEKKYVYATHYAPHDIEVRELGTGKSRLETARSLGIKFQIVPKLGLEDGIEAARGIFNRCWFDMAKCKLLLNALKNYRKEYDEERGIYKSYPFHDWSSHAADAFRYFAISSKDQNASMSLKARVFGQRDRLINPATGF